jgi:hypothetical protein
MLGCAREAVPAGRAAPPQPVEVAPPGRYTEREQTKLESGNATATGQEVLLSGPLAGAPAARAEAKSLDLGGEIYAVQQVMGGGSSSPPPPPPAVAPTAIPIAKPADQATPREMIDTEARVELEVESVDRAVGSIRSLVASVGGSIVNEVVEDTPDTAGAALSLRVPSGKVDETLAALGRTGKMLSRKVESKDVGREYHDAGILLGNLTATLKRYEELLAKAQGTPQVLEIERELARVRTQLDRVKGDMQWLRDRVARATIYVTLSSPNPDEPLAEPTASLYPGLRATSVVDFSGANGSDTYLGGGVSVRFSRNLSFDADWLTSVEDSDGVELFIATGGVEIYSDLLGGGKRKFLNPYLGFRVGYARLRGDGAFAPAGVLGLELWKSEVVTIELDARGFGFIQIEEDTHAALQTTLGFNVAY